MLEIIFLFTHLFNFTGWTFFMSVGRGGGWRWLQWDDSLIITIIDNTHHRKNQGACAKKRTSTAVSSLIVSTCICCYRSSDREKWSEVIQASELPQPLEDNKSNHSLQIKVETELVIETYFCKKNTGEQWWYCSTERCFSPTSFHCLRQAPLQAPLQATIISSRF
jgi:hypothetical protein